MSCGPEDRPLVVNTSVPFDVTLPEESRVGLLGLLMASKNDTVPEGIPVPGRTASTVAVKLIAWPKLQLPVGLLVRIVCVPSTVTTNGSGLSAPALPASRLLPL